MAGASGSVVYELKYEASKGLEDAETDHDGYYEIEG